MTDTELLEKWEAEEEAFALKGWDFSLISEKWSCPEPPWSYRKIVKSYLKDTDILLDMGTGGGEILLTLGHPHGNTYATEAYLPNYELCKKELEPLGITVARTFDDDKLPFEDESFDFIINRHESFDLTEVNRTLKHGGYFFTQQVGNENSRELMAELNDGKVFHNAEHTAQNYADTLRSLGFQIIIKDEVKYPVKYFDVSAVIFYAKACVWEAPGFTVKTHFDKLRKYQDEIDKNGFAQVTGHRFLLAARKA